MTEEQTLSIQKAIELAVHHHTSGDVSKAEDIAQQILKIHPNQPVALHLLGVIAYQAGKNEIAVDWIMKVLTINPDFAEAHSNLGLVFQRLGQLDEAVVSYNRAIEINPKFAEAHDNLGNALKDLGDLNEALVNYDKAIAINPNYAEAHSNLGLILHDLGMCDQAVACCKKAIAIKPDYAEAHYNLGLTLQVLGQHDEAVANYYKAIVIKPNYAEAHNNLGNVLCDLGQLDEAVVSYNKALAIKPDYSSVHFNLHALTLAPHNIMISINHVKKAVNIESSNNLYRFFLGMLLDYSGDSQGAATQFEFVERGENLDLARLDAWHYIKSNNNGVPLIIGGGIEALELGINASRQEEGLVLEFGVRFGTSIRQIAQLAKQEVHGFDSFEGLPEAWHHEPIGSYSTKGVVPSVPDNVILHNGWFEETLPIFIDQHQGPIRFMNIDCDIYSSTKTIFDLLAKQITHGTVIVFDEYIGNVNWREDEFKAFQEAVISNGWEYEYLCFSFMTKQVVVQIN